MVQRVAARPGPSAARPPATAKSPVALVRGASASVQQALASTLGMEGERMSKVDTAWLRMDSPSNLMMIVGVWILRPGLTPDALKERVRERLLPYPRFVQIAREDAAGAHWSKDPDFQIDRHIVTHKLKRRPGQTEQDALQDRVGDLAMQALDPEHPLWRFELIQRYDGGSALIARIHHCIADGIALISVMMSLVDGGGAPPSASAASPRRSAWTAPRTGWPTR